MSCINKRGTRKTAHVEPSLSSRALKLYIKLPTNLGRIFFVKLYVGTLRWKDVNPRETGKPVTLWATRRDTTMVVFLAIDLGISLTINASIDKVRDMPGTVVVINSQTTPPRPVAFLT